MTKPTDLEPSRLGTKEYWDNLYKTEIANHAHDPADTGTVWFDDSDAENKLVAFLEDRSQEQEEDFAVLADQSKTSFLDLGTGNGALLFCLRDAGWEGPMLGVDYSPLSVEFARRIERGRRLGDGDRDGRDAEEDGEEKKGGEIDIHFQEYDLLHDSPSTILTPSFSPTVAAAGGWDVVLDKGTFDAISLSAETTRTTNNTNINITTINTTANATTESNSTTRRINSTYPSRILPLIREGGLFLVTSCNWTEDELRGWFEEDSDTQLQGEWAFKVVGRVEYRSFSFGGVKGQTISSLCFRKVRRQQGGSST
ncbi:hypothetical protein F5Y16DRAFT_15173 [Xylariaceae sp. FL0255]|nr:hypothetical protein F5Y16DRAFT_15173 [Xylariaceae sp. FL0255]